MKNLHKYVIGQKDVISVKHMPQKNILLVQAKKIGHCEVIIWPDSKNHTKYQFYVVSKQQHLKLIHLVKLISGMNLKYSLDGPLIKVTGIVQSLENYLLLKKLLKKYPNELFIHVRPSKELRNFIISEIYYIIFKEQKDLFYCTNLNLEITCFYSKTTPLDHNLIKLLTDQYPVQFVPIETKITYLNYLVRLKILQLEDITNQSVSLGIEGLSFPLRDLFSNNAPTDLLTGHFQAKRNLVHISTIASPESLVQLGQKVSLELGSEIPYVINGETPTTQWKFAGLKLELKLLEGKDPGQVELIYSTQYTSAAKENILGSKGQSKVIINLDHPTVLFKIGHKSKTQNRNRWPILSNFPLFENILSSNHKSKNYKKIIVLALIEKVNDRK